MTRLTVPEVAAELRCNEETVRRLINAPGGIRAAKVGGRWLVDPEDLATWVESRANRPKPRQRRRRSFGEV